MVHGVVVERHKLIFWTGKIKGFFIFHHRASGNINRANVTRNAF